MDLIKGHCFLSADISVHASFWAGRCFQQSEAAIAAGGIASLRSAVPSLRGGAFNSQKPQLRLFLISRGFLPKASFRRKAPGNKKGSDFQSLPSDC